MDTSLQTARLDYVLIAREAVRLQVIRPNQIDPLSSINTLGNEQKKIILGLYRRCISKLFDDCTIRRNTHNISIKISDTPSYEHLTKLARAWDKCWIRDDEVTDIVDRRNGFNALPHFQISVRDDNRAFLYVKYNQAIRESTMYQAYMDLHEYKALLERATEVYNRYEQEITEAEAEAERIRLLREQRQRAREEAERHMNAIERSEASEILDQIDDVLNQYNPDQSEYDQIVRDLIALAEEDLNRIDQVEEEQKQDGTVEQIVTLEPDASLGDLIRSVMNIQDNSNFQTAFRPVEGWNNRYHVTFTPIPRTEYNRDRWNSQEWSQEDIQAYLDQRLRERAEARRRENATSTD